MNSSKHQDNYVKISLQIIFCITDVQLKDAPDSPKVTIDRNPVTVGETVMLTCNTKNNYLPEIGWMKTENNDSNTQRIIVKRGQRSGNSLSLDITDVEQSGFYWCQAKINDHEKMSETPEQLIVNGLYNCDCCN